nr:hypothetical protein [Streptomyces adelaidensis]
MDQFEKVFTLCRDAEERDAFVAALPHAAQTSESRCRVVPAVRSDFSTHCTRLPPSSTPWPSPTSPSAR